MPAAVWIVVVVALWLADRRLLAAERRGGIYYPKTKAPKGAAAERMLHLASIWDHPPSTSSSSGTPRRTPRTRTPDLRTTASSDD